MGARDLRAPDLFPILKDYLMLRYLRAFALLWPLLVGPAMAQDASATLLQDVLQTVQADVASP